MYSAEIKSMNPAHTLYADGVLNCTWDRPTPAFKKLWAAFSITAFTTPPEDTGGMIPEEPSGGAFSHQRAQSFDSMSSGHSSGSGSVAQTEFLPSRRRVVVKPLDEPDDEAPAYMRRLKETPIEREIRLAREREEELRREKGLPVLSATDNQSPVNKQEVRKVVGRNVTNLNDSRSMQHRLATSRIQQEINEVTEREKELHAAGMIQTISEDTVDSKVTRITDLMGYSMEEKERKLQKSMSVSSLSTECENGNIAFLTSPIQKNCSPFPNSVQNLSGRQTFAVSTPKKASPYVPQKGVMQRFLASHGKVNTLSLKRSPNVSPPPVQVTSTPPVVLRRSVIDLIPAEHQNSDNETSRILTRRGYQSAEEKIQVELQEMQKREEELRLQRARMFARSQPNLLCIRDEDEESSQIYGEMGKSPTLRSSQSNPNLFDSDESQPSKDTPDSAINKQSQRNSRKKSALIAQWENRIQQNIEH